MNKKNVRFLCLCLSALLSVNTNSCKEAGDSNERVVASIDDFKITYRNFEEQFEKLHPGKLISKAPDEMKTDVLNDMIEQQLILFEAFRLGYDKDENILKYIKGREKVLAGDALRDQEVDGKIITEAMIDRYYRLMDRRIHLYRMKFSFNSDSQNRQQAEKKAGSVYEKLQSGADFKKLAAQYSEHTTAQKDSGNMRILGCFDIDLNLFEQAASLAEGGISPPFDDKNAVYILKVEKIYPAERDTAEKERPTITEKLKQIYASQLTEQFYKFKKSIVDEFKNKLYPANISFFCSKAGTINTRSDSSGLFSPEEKKLVLSSTSFEETTIGKFFPLVFEYYWASLNQERLVKMLLSERNLRRSVNYKAMQLGINSLPEVQTELERWKIYYLKQFVIQREIMDKINTSDIVLLPIYENQKRKLINKEQRLVREIFCKTKEDIEKVYRLAVQGHDFETLEKKYQENQETRNHGLIGPFPKGPNGKLGEFAFEMQLNEISKPFQYRGGYSIIQLLSIEPERQKTYAEAKEEIKARYLDENRKKFISEWADKSKENYDISINKI